MEEEAYFSQEWVRGAESEESGGELPKGFQREKFY
jgi:hypothetical protein